MKFNHKYLLAMALTVSASPMVAKAEGQKIEHPSVKIYLEDDRSYINSSIDLYLASDRSKEEKERLFQELNKRPMCAFLKHEQLIQAAENPEVKQGIRELEALGAKYVHLKERIRRNSNNSIMSDVERIDYELSYYFGNETAPRTTSIIVSEVSDDFLKEIGTDNINSSNSFCNTRADWHDHETSFNNVFVNTLDSVKHLIAGAKYSLDQQVNAKKYQAQKQALEMEQKRKEQEEQRIEREKQKKIEDQRRALFDKTSFRDPRESQKESKHFDSQSQGVAVELRKPELHQVGSAI